MRTLITGMEMEVDSSEGARIVDEVMEREVPRFERLRCSLFLRAHMQSHGVQAAGVAAGHPGTSTLEGRDKPAAKAKAGAKPKAKAEGKPRAKAKADSEISTSNATKTVQNWIGRLEALRKDLYETYIVRALQPYAEDVLTANCQDCTMWARELQVNKVARVGELVEALKAGAVNTKTMAEDLENCLLEAIPCGRPASACIHTSSACTHCSPAYIVHDPCQD